MGSPHVTSGRGGDHHPHVPAFCRTRRPVAVTASSLTALRLLVLLGLLFQLSTLLLVLAGPVPLRLAALSTSTVFRSDASTDAGEVPPVTPLSER